MADVPDWLLDVSGGALGLNRGAVLAADPYKAWDAVQKTGLENRNLEAEQLAREQLPGYYGNRATAADTATRLATSKGTSDIYGTDTALAMQKALGPGSAFQAEMQARGLTPNMPEYMRRAEEVIGQYSPQAGIASESLFKIPETQNRNTMDQFFEQYLTAQARKADPNAIAVRQPDGTFMIYGSQGERIPVNADQLMFIASSLKGGDPAQVYRQGLETQKNMQVGNAAMVTALGNYQKSVNTNVWTPAQIAAQTNSARIGHAQYVKSLDNEIARLEKDQNFQFKSEEEKAAILGPLKQKKEEANVKLQRVLQILDARGTELGFSGRQPVSGGNAVIGPQGGSSLNFGPAGSIGGGLAVTGQRPQPPGAVQAVPAAVDPFQSPSRMQDVMPAAPPMTPPVTGSSPFLDKLLGIINMPPAVNTAQPMNGLEEFAPGMADFFNFNSPPTAAPAPMAPTANANPGLEQYIASLLSGQA